MARAAIIIIVVILVILLTVHHFGRPKKRLAFVQADTPLSEIPGGWRKADVDCMVFFDSWVVIQRSPPFGPIKRYAIRITSDQLVFEQAGQAQHYRRTMEYDSDLDLDYPFLLIDDTGPLVPGRYEYLSSSHCRKENFRGFLPDRSARYRHETKSGG